MFKEEKAIAGENDLFTIFPKLEEWDVEKNKDVDPRNEPIYPSKVWWICPKGHSYLSAVSNRTKNMARPMEMVVLTAVDRKFCQD